MEVGPLIWSKESKTDILFVARYAKLYRKLLTLNGADLSGMVASFLSFIMAN